MGGGGGDNRAEQGLCAPADVTLSGGGWASTRSHECPARSLGKVPPHSRVVVLTPLAGVAGWLPAAAETVGVEQGEGGGREGGLASQVVGLAGQEGDESGGEGQETEGWGGRALGCCCLWPLGSGGWG